MQPTGLTLDQVKAAVARITGIEVSYMESPCRRGVVVKARDLAIYLCRKLTDRSYLELGIAFGNRDHSTIIYSIQRMEKRYVAFVNVRVQADRVLEYLKNPMAWERANPVVTPAKRLFHTSRGRPKQFPQ